MNSLEILLVAAAKHGRQGKRLSADPDMNAMSEQRNYLIERLLAAPNGVNPAVEMSELIARLHRAGQLSPSKIETLMPQIEAAADQGERDLDAAGAALRSLSRAGAVSAREVPPGF